MTDIAQSQLVSIRGGALLGALAIIAVTAMIAATCGQIMATALGATEGAPPLHVELEPTEPALSMLSRGRHGMTW